MHFNFLLLSLNIKLQANMDSFEDEEGPEDAKKGEENDKPTQEPSCNKSPEQSHPPVSDPENYQPTDYSQDLGLIFFRILKPRNKNEIITFLDESPASDEVSKKEESKPQLAQKKDEKNRKSKTKGTPAKPQKNVTKKSTSSNNKESLAVICPCEDPSVLFSSILPLFFFFFFFFF